MTIDLFSFFLFLIRISKWQPNQRPRFCAQRSGAFGVKEQPCAEKSFFRHLSLDFLPPACYNQRSFILTKAMMRTNRCPVSMAQRGLPRKGAASSLPCTGYLPPQSAEVNLCRVRPLQHSEWHALACNSGGTVERLSIFRRFIP